MKAVKRIGIALLRTALLALALSGITGCGGSAGPQTHPVKGQVQLAGGEIKNLAGQSVEAALDKDPTTRAYGQILPDGSFTLETLQAGTVRPGAAEGKYRVRLVLSDDDPEARRRAARTVHPRYLQFQAAGLSLQVPSKDLVTLALSKQ